jgi:hypothetical protein
MIDYGALYNVNTFLAQVEKNHSRMGTGQRFILKFNIRNISRILF